MKLNFKFFFILGVFITQANLFVYSQEKAIYEKYGVIVESLQTGLNVGEAAFGFEGKTQKNTTFNLEEALKKGPVIVNFFRGSWCPYCVKHLMHVNDSLQMIQDVGGTFIAITPETEDRFTAFAAKKDLAFDIIGDPNLDIMNGYKVTFEVNEGYQKMLKKYDNDLTSTNSIKKAALPVPATFIIGQNGKIIARHYNPNYKGRMSVKEILQALENI